MRKFQGTLRLQWKCGDSRNQRMLQLPERVLAGQSLEKGASGDAICAG